jgi:cell division protein FtsQ
VLTRRPTNRRKDQLTRLEWLRALGWQRLSMIAGLGCAVLGAGATSAWLINRPIQHISVVGSFQRVSAAELEKLARQRIASAGFVSVNLAAVRSALRELPWIDDVSVQRTWPRGLQLTVVEQVAIARWNSTALVNARGEVFHSDERFMPAGLPQLSGPEGSDAEVVARFLATQGRMVEAGAHLVAVAVDARGAWSFRLDNGVEVRLGRAQVDERYQRFVTAALPMLAEHAAEINYVDMRYTNGFAVGWKDHPARFAKQSDNRELIPDA